MKTVYKYPMPRRLKNFSMVLPLGYKFLRVAFQEENLFMWAEVDKDATKTEHNFAVYGTGQDIPNHAAYLATYDDSAFVFHIYRL